MLQCFQMLLSNLSGVSDRSAFDDSQVSPTPENKNVTLKGVEQLVFNNTHETINAILSVSPLAARSALLQVSVYFLQKQTKKKLSVQFRVELTGINSQFLFSVHSRVSTISFDARYPFAHKLYEKYS